jgi:hypothetical protein
LLGFRLLVDLQGKNTVLERSGNSLWVGIFRQLEGTAERREPAFPDQVIPVRACFG